MNGPDEFSVAPDADRPDVSVIVPCYNAASTLAQTIASLQAQTHANWEAVCVDDESDDDTPHLLDALARSDSRVRWLRVPHRGLAATRNRGLPLVRADRVLFLDADDVVRPDALTVLLGAAKAVGDDSIITAGYELLDESGRPLSIFRWPTVPEFSVAAFLKANRISVMTLVPVRLLGDRPFDDALLACEDWDLWLRLAQRGVKCVSLPRVLFGNRLRSGSLSQRADLFHAMGRRVLERWLPQARDPEAVADVRQRWAWACGALAAALGSPAAIHRYFADLPSGAPTEDFLQAAAGSLHWAYQFVRGAAGLIWRDRRDEWLAQIESWLRQTPLTAHAPIILAHLARTTDDPDRRLAAVRRFLAARPHATRVVLYGLGTNGLGLLEFLHHQLELTTETRSSPRTVYESSPCPPCLRGFPLVCIADDFAPPLVFSTLGLPRDDPRTWRHWPRGTVVIVTPNDYRNLRATCLRAGGREGGDFFVVMAEARAAAPSGDHPRPRAKEAVSL